MPRPSVYLFYGNNALSMAEAVDSLRQRLGDSADMNFQRFEAASLVLNQLQQAANAMPFLADRRLIVIDGAERLPTRAGFADALHAVLEALPPSTALVFAAQLSLDRRSAEADFAKRSPVHAWATAHPDSSYLKLFAQPSGPAFSRWLIDRAAEHSATLEPQAADLLAVLVDEDALLAEQELRKLADYAADGKPITAAAVERLTPMYGLTDVFEVVDGLTGGAQSLGRLHRLMQEQSPAYVFLMVARQFRLLLQARHALDNGQDPVQSLGVPGFVARKITAQAKGFSSQVLASFYRKLVALEVDAKRGKADLALDLIPLLAGLAPTPG